MKFDNFRNDYLLVTISFKYLFVLFQFFNKLCRYQLLKVKEKRKSKLIIIYIISQLGSISYLVSTNFPLLNVGESFCSHFLFELKMFIKICTSSISVLITVRKNFKVVIFVWWVLYFTIFIVSLRFWTFSFWRVDTFFDILLLGFRIYLSSICNYIYCFKLSNLKNNILCRL